jgi:DNA-binding transcriptional LysR family regulator
LGGTARRFEINDSVRADDFQTIRGLISEGVGIGWLPDFLSEEGRKSGLLVPALPGWKARDEGTVHFLYGGRKHSSATVRSFIEVALDQVSKLLRPE